MNDEKVTGYCYLNSEYLRIGIVCAAFLVIFCLLTVAFSIYVKEPRVLSILLFLLPALIWWLYARRYGLDRYAAFELSEAGIQTSSASPKMDRNFSWNEVSLVQITKIEEVKRRCIYIPPVDCYVFVKGRENALIRCQAMETFGHIFSNPNRIAVPVDERTEPFVTAVAEQYGIPMEKSLIVEN